MMKGNEGAKEEGPQEKEVVRCNNDRKSAEDEDEGEGKGRVDKLLKGKEGSEKYVEVLVIL